MSGICGTVNWGNSSTLAEMTRVQTHRGPDDNGVWEHRLPDGTFFALGNRRLAILDLSPAGHMPMSNQDGSIWITFNGEIYNFPILRDQLETQGHRFRSRSDTEVLLHMYEEYGVACLDRLNGMFAFAICDLRPTTPFGSGPVMFIARDHFGVKPLYYIRRGARFAFASEIKSLLCLPDFTAELDPESISQFLSILWVPDPQTSFREVWKLLAGHYAVFRAGDLQLREYWDLTFPRAGAQSVYTEQELIEEVRYRFRKAVGSQMISDVPIGSLLSGGLDSSSIVAMMSRFTDRVRTYTVTFPPKHRRGQSTLDDPKVADKFARRLGTDHHQIMVEPDIVALLPKLIWHLDEPIADPAVIAAYLVCREASSKVKVLLSGTGGDEVFAGYRKYVSQKWSSLFQLVPPFIRRGLVERVVTGLPSMRGSHVSGLVRLAKKFVRTAELPPREAFLASSCYLSEDFKSQLCCAALKDGNHTDPFLQHRTYFERAKEADFLNQMLYVDTKTFLISLNLTYNDKMSMASSVEVRAPYLDKDLVEFAALNVPPHMKIHGALWPTTKYILRRAMQGILPQELLQLPKAGFGAPVDYWLAQDLREMVDDLLSADRLRRRGYFNSATVARMLQEYRSGSEDWSMQIWQLLTFELWMQTFLDQPQPTIQRPWSVVT